MPTTRFSNRRGRPGTIGFGVAYLGFVAVGIIGTTFAPSPTVVRMLGETGTRWVSLIWAGSFAVAGAGALVARWCWWTRVELAFTEVIVGLCGLWVIGLVAEAGRTSAMLIAVILAFCAYMIGAIRSASYRVRSGIDVVLQRALDRERHG
jgi:hypothetical protein